MNKLQQEHKKKFRQSFSLQDDSVHGSFVFVCYKFLAVLVNKREGDVGECVCVCVCVCVCEIEDNSASIHSAGY